MAIPKGVPILPARIAPFGHSLTLKSVLWPFMEGQGMGNCRNLLVESDGVAGVQEVPGL